MAESKPERIHVVCEECRFHVGSIARMLGAVRSREPAKRIDEE